MLGKMFSKSKSKKEVEPPPLIFENLTETLGNLEKSQALMEGKIEAELSKARKYSMSKNDRAAIMCLKRKKLYEAQVQKLENSQLRITGQISMLQTAAVTTDTVKALKQGAETMKNHWKNMKIDDVDKTMDEINEQTENMKQIQESLSGPLGGFNIDEEDLLNELKELDAEDLELENLASLNVSLPTPHGQSYPAYLQEKIQPNTEYADISSLRKLPIPIPTSHQQRLPEKSQRPTEEEELSALREDMALL